MPKPDDDSRPTTRLIVYSGSGAHWLATPHRESFNHYWVEGWHICRTAGRLDGLMDKQFGTLSGGQKQRMLFALALAGNPDAPRSSLPYRPCPRRSAKPDAAQAALR